VFENLPHLMANRSGLLQVFQNLIGNALKYQMPNAEPQIKVSAQEDEKQIIFSFQDNY